MFNKYVYRLVLFVFILGSFGSVNARGDDSSDLVNTHSDDFTIWWYEKLFVSIGSYYYENIDVESLTNEKRKELLDKGIEVCSEGAVSGEGYHYRLILTKYWFSKKDYRRALYWANKGAEKGSFECMDYLSEMYGRGKGTVEDLAECFKWVFLSSALIDNPYSKPIIRCREFSRDSYFEKNFNEGRKRAQEWQREHSEIFSGP